MKILVTMLGGNVYTFDVEPATTVRDVKELIQTKDNVPPNQQRLALANHLLDDAHTLDYYGAADGARLYLLYEAPRAV